MTTRVRTPSLRPPGAPRDRRPSTAPGTPPRRRRRATGDTALRHLLGELRRGNEWEVAYAAYRARVGGPEPLPFADGRVNWSWLTDLPDLRRAVDFGSSFGDVAADLALECPDVRYVGSAGPHGRVVAARLASCGGRVTTTLSASRVAHTRIRGADLVSFVATPGWQQRLPPWTGGLPGLPEALTDPLRPGGWLALLLPNPAWHHGLRAGRSGLRRATEEQGMLRAFRAGLRRAGVTEIREYLTTPRVDCPKVIVPRRRAAVLGYCRSVHAGARHRMLVRAGLYPMLFPGLLVLAKK